MAQKANELQAAIVTFLNYHGYFVWVEKTVGIYDPTKKIFRKSKTNMAGKSDIIGITPEGRFIAIEVKIGKDFLKQEQIYFLDNIKSKGGIAITVKSFDEFLNHFNNKFGL